MIASSEDHADAWAKTLANTNNLAGIIAMVEGFYDALHIVLVYVKAMCAKFYRA